MRSPAIISAGLLLLTPLAGASATAAPRSTPVPKVVALPCRIVTDPPGDEAMAPGHLASADIVSADLSADTKNVTAVIRVKSYDVPSGTGLRVYVLSWMVPALQKTLFLGATETIAGLGTSEYNYAAGFAKEPAASTNDYTWSAAASGFVAAGANEIHITVPIAALAKAGAVIKPKFKFTTLQATTWLVNGAFARQVDIAQSTRSYRVGDKSCVQPGK